MRWPPILTVRSLDLHAFPTPLSMRYPFENVGDYIQM
jgi:hypothetical protein